MACDRGCEAVSEALVILKPRQIQATEAALDELASWLPVIELVGYTEQQLADGIFAEALARYPHDHYIVASDDLIVRWHAVDAIIDRLTDDSCVTGYCQFTHTDWRVNVTRRPLVGDTPNKGAYEFLSYHEMVSGPAVRRTWFAGMSLTAMSADMWEAFPFGCFSDEHGRGYASDFHLSKRLQDVDVPIQVVRDAFSYHWRHEQAHTNDPRDDRVLVGRVDPEIRLRSRSVRL